MTVMVPAADPPPVVQPPIEEELDDGPIPKRFHLRVEPERPAHVTEADFRIRFEMDARGQAFLLLDAEFLAAVQLLLYAGGIITVVVFAIVVTERLVGERISQTSRRLAAGAVVCSAIAGLLGSAVWRQPLAIARPAMEGDLTRALGENVLTRFVLPFELLAVLMLTALLGAIYFARTED